MNNYPPGVTGNEYEIAGPDYEQEIDGICSNCLNYNYLMEQGYRHEHWVVCTSCGNVEDLPDFLIEERGR